MDNETKAMFNTILEEMGRMEDRINKRFDSVDDHFDKIEARMEIMQHEINACKLDHETISLLIKKVDQHDQRIEELEKKTA
ncbi:MAG: hemagglutinin [Lachnospiraceae bacterium]|nr:hemagglutinin [Lachnospiraceae bacterium]MBD5503735.1 hemagglutinin [Lachnospiraceae bacterium]